MTSVKNKATVLAETADEIARLIMASSLEDGDPSMPIEEVSPETGHIGHRFMTRENPHLRLSFGNCCHLQKWLWHNATDEMRPPNFKSRMNFCAGDLWEALALHALKLKLLTHPTLEWVKDSEQHVVENTDGIRGHIDGMIYHKGANALILVDPKSSTSWAFKRWEDGRKPSEIWGYRHQAANYLLALEPKWQKGADGQAEEAQDKLRARYPGAPVIGMIWPVQMRDKGFMDCGWMTDDELAPYAGDTQECFDNALMGTAPPAPIHPCRSKAPCRPSKNGEPYCDAYDACVARFPIQEEN